MTTTTAPAQVKRREPIRLEQYRCSCGRLLFRAKLAPGSTVEAWCKKCDRPVLIKAA